MSGIPVVISSHGGIPVRQVASGAPVMTVATNGFGIPIVLSNRGLPFVVQGLAPAPSWSVQPSISGTPQVGQTLTGSDGTIANGTVTLRQWLNAADNSVLGTGSTLLLTEAMEGLNIKFKVTAVGTGGSAAATSTQVGPVTEAATGGTFTGTPSITGTRGGTLTGTNATFTGTDTLSGQWYYDGVATGDTDTSFNDTDTSKVVEYRNTLAISGETASAYLEVAPSAPLYFNDFSSATAGKPLAAQYITAFSGGVPTYSNVPNGPGVPGWIAVHNDAATAQSYKTGIGGGIYRSEGWTAITVYDVGDTSHYAEYVVAREGSAEERFLLLVGVGEPTGSTSAFSIRLNVRIVGSTYDWLRLPDGVNIAGGAPCTDGDILGVRVKGSGAARRVYVSLNGNPLNPSGYNPTGLGGYVVGDRVGLGSEEERPVTGAKNIHSIAVYPGEQPSVLAAIEEGSTTAWKLAITYSNTVSGATNTQYRVDVEDGPMVQGWTNIGATGDGTIDYDVPDAQAGKSLRVAIRNVGGTVRIAASSPVLVPFPPSKFAKGINNSGAGVNYRNLFARMEIRFPSLSPWGALLQPGRAAFTDAGSGTQYLAASVVGMGYDGIIQQYASGYPANIVYLCSGVYVETGIYEIYYQTPNCVLTNSTGGTLADATILTPFSGGYGKIQITTSMPSLRFTFSGGTSGSLNLKPTGYFESDTNRSRLYAESSIIPFTTIGAIGERYLDPLIGNGDGVLRLTADQIWDGGAGVTGPWSPEMIAQKANAEGVREIWIPVSYLWRGEAFLTAFFTRLLTVLDPNIKVRVEWQNEAWNTSFRNGTQWLLQTSVDAGLWNTNGDATPIASNYAWSGVDYNPAFSSLSMLRAYNKDDYVLFENIYGVGHVLLQAKKNIVTGTADYPTVSGSTIIESTAWLPIAQASDCLRAKMRYYSEWCDTLWDIVDAVCVDLGLNPREKIIRQICWQQGAPPANVIDWNNLHERIDSYGIAPYHNPNLLKYDESPLTSGEKALLATDIPGFINACYTHATAGVASKIAEFPAFKAAIDAVWAARGYAENAKETVTYEFGGHVEAKNGSGGNWHANMSTAFPMFRRDARYGTLTQTYTQAWKDTLHSPTYYFNSVGELPNNYNGQYGYWPLMEYNTDITNVAYVGFGNVTDDT